MWIDSVTLEPSVVIEVAVHPSPDAQAIIINYPGYLGSIDGYNKKYATIADHLSQKKVGAVVRMANTLWPHINYRQSVLDDLRAVIRYTLGHAAEMCATATPDIYLMGFSPPSRHLVVLPNCDHQFRGRVNGQIMSKAPLWAFAGEATFPSPEGGTVLY